jgi:hypothetical protein
VAPVSSFSRATVGGPIAPRQGLRDPRIDLTLPHGFPPRAFLKPSVSSRRPGIPPPKRVCANSPDRIRTCDLRFVGALSAQIERAINYLAFVSPSFCDGLRLLDSTPVPCAASRQTTRRSDLAGIGAYGYCRSHSRYFWGFRLYLLCAADGTPIGFELAPANEPEREVAKEMLEAVSLAGYTVIADKGFAGEDFEAFMASRGARFLRPDRKDEQPRFGTPGRGAPVGRVGVLEPQGPARPGAPRGSHPARALRPNRCSAAGPLSGSLCTTGRLASPGGT